MLAIPAEERVRLLIFRAVPRISYRLAAVVGVGGMAAVYLTNATSVLGRELSPSGTVVAFRWTMQPRFGLDENGNGLLDLPNTYDYVGNRQGCSEDVPRFRVDFDFTGTVVPSATANITPSHFRVQIHLQNGVLAIDTTTTTPKVAACLPEGESKVAVTAWHSENPLAKAEGNHEIVVEDLLIVSIGDSYASGEGAPERKVGDFGERPYIWADDGVSSFDGSPGKGLPSQVLKDHNRAHRSTLSAPAQFALMLERADEHTSVTFVSLAASGATMDEGVLSAYSGVSTEPYSNPPLEPQINAIRRAICRRTYILEESFICMRRIDALLMNIGGNDVGFADVIEHLIRADGASALYWFSRLGGFKKLAANYDALASRLNAREQRGDYPSVHSVYITAIPDPTLHRGFAPNGPIGTCKSVLGGIAFSKEIDSNEMRSARANLLQPLNDTLVAAAREHGWTVVDARDAFRGHGLCMNRPYAASSYRGNHFPDPPEYNGDWNDRWFRSAAEA